MKYLISVIALFVGLPALAMTASVSINPITDLVSPINFTGTAVMGEGQSLSTNLDGAGLPNSLTGADWQTGDVAVRPGNHSITANINSGEGVVATVSQSFSVAGGGNGNPLQITQTAWGMTGFEIIEAGLFLKSGEGDCPAWFPAGCWKMK